MAAEPLHLSTTHDEYDLGEHLDYIEDKQGAWTIEKLAAQDLDWQRSKASVPSFGFTDSVYWLRLSIDSGELGPELADWILQVSYPVLDWIELYIPQPDGTFQKKTMGDHLPFAKRDIANQNFLFRLKLSGVQTFYLRCQTTGSMKIPLKLLNAEAFHHTITRENLAIGFFTGIIVVMMLYNSFLWFSLRELNYLYYIAYIGLFLVFNLALNGFAYQYLWPHSIWLANYSIPISIYGSAGFALAFSRRFLRTQYNVPLIDKFIFVLILWILLGLCGIPFLSYTLTAKLSTSLSFVLNLVLISAGAVLVKRGDRAARFYMLAFASIWTGMAIKALQTLGLIPVSSFSENGIYIGSIAEVILLSLALGDKVHHEQLDSQRKINSLNRDLEDHVRTLDTQVEAKTRDIKSMLVHINQGIFTIELQGGVVSIGADFSDYLTEILESKDLAGTALMASVFAHSSLTSDELATIQSALTASLGEDLLTFELNAGTLPREFDRNFSGDRRKTLEIDWCPVLDAKNEGVGKILITLRDVTALRVLQLQNSEQQDELSYISELINVPVGSFSRFMKSARILISENWRLLASSQQWDDEVLKILLINMHTLKGNARGLGLGKLASQVHEIEQYYMQMRIDPDKRWDKEQIGKGLTDSEAILEKYSEIGKHKLGRSEISERIWVDKNLIRAKILDLANFLLRPAPEDIKAFLKLTSDDLKNLIFRRSGEVIQEALRSLPSLARDLRKEIPNVELAVDEFNLTEHGEEILKNVFVHILRNSLDHGIEHPEVRIASGKEPKGRIRVLLQLVGDHYLRIRFQDDGRGIDLQRLREIGQNLQLLPKDRLTDVDLVANLIFHEGVSTSKTVNEISGRGIGMGAIREYFRSSGGEITLDLEKQSRSDADFVNFALEMRLPLVSVIV
ncbi:MAG TPA: 7TM diverse intracellular signaling domain-containing protein [Oligoflexus sp.]|uniref:7TM diverse intracellular signaling domain-containing protein n=1 Tax=Oligoflexus sp. TaxID=1971216 RepID=UPI002D45987A|nr:7TM diverse intracellular signaling domain-containing protein [Oligoflexus sp.]HYX36304.1 7TM diverse intracellular signaling domain-containing protein [Oligoflexus sp.]